MNSLSRGGDLKKCITLPSIAEIERKESQDRRGKNTCRPPRHLDVSACGNCVNEISTSGITVVLSILFCSRSISGFDIDCSLQRPCVESYFEISSTETMDEGRRAE